jgi:hypothetical protein
MSTTIYCRFNSYCVNTRCADKHHHNPFERQLLFSIINRTPEIVQCKEIKVAKPICKHGLRCFEVDCEMRHGLNPDGRRILRKKFDKELKTIQMREKIRAEIETYRNGVSYDWNDLDTRP